MRLGEQHLTIINLLKIDLRMYFFFNTSYCVKVYNMNKVPTIKNCTYMINGYKIIIAEMKKKIR